MFDKKISAKTVRLDKELQLIFEISTLLSVNTDMKEILPQVLERISNYYNIISGTITILNRADDEITTEAFYGMAKEAANKGRYRRGEGITGRVFDTGNHVIIEKISKEPDFLDRTGIHKPLKCELSFICVPIKLEHEVIGALSVDMPYSLETDLGAFSRLLTIIASLINLTVHIRQESVEELQSLQNENIELQAKLNSGYKPKNIIGNSKIMRSLYIQIEQVAKTNTTVLLQGESGVGKERFAEAIHHCSQRADQPFIKLNCAALPESIIQSELFGHEKGAFTDAVRLRKGHFELADGGTLFLDEIGDMPLSIQGKFLRVLQEHQFERIGGSNTVHVDVRIITATNRDLQKLIAEGKFRIDLYYRLNVFPLVIPPLRERRTDIMLLVDHFIKMYTSEQNKKITSISRFATNLMMAYDWPGNVRELSNCIERAVILSTDGIIHSYYLPTSMQKSASENGKQAPLKDILEMLERDILQNELDKNNGSMTKTAAVLGISERIMGLRVLKYNLKH
jgi:Nif-specific regulatory protein